MSDAGRHVRFRPVYRVDDEFVQVEAPSDPAFVSRLRKVLAYYDVPFEEAGGELLVSESLAADLDTCRNYTNKANDEHWLGSHVSNAFRS